MPRSILSVPNKVYHNTETSEPFHFNKAVNSGALFQATPYKTDAILPQLTAHLKFQTDGAVVTDLFYQPGTPLGRRHFFIRKRLKLVVNLRAERRELTSCLADATLLLDSAGYCPPNSRSVWFAAGTARSEDLMEMGFGEGGASEDNVVLDFNFSLIPT